MKKELRLELRLESGLDIVCKQLRLSPARVKSLKKAYGTVCDKFPKAKDWELMNAFWAAERSRGVSYEAIMTNVLTKTKSK